MDIGKKCLIIGVVGAILAIASSPFLTYMIFTGKPIETFTEEKTLEPYPPNVFGPTFRIIDNRTDLPYKVVEFFLRPGEGKEQYKVLLNVETNGTIDVSVFSKNSSFNYIRTFNAGNYTVELQVLNEDLYSLNVTRIGSDKIGVTFKIVESWYYTKTNILVKLDYLKTLGSIIGFAAGITLLVAAVVKLRKAAREARPEAVEESVTKRRYIEVEEEE